MEKLKPGINAQYLNQNPEQRAEILVKYRL